MKLHNVLGITLLLTPFVRRALPKLGELLKQLVNTINGRGNKTPLLGTLWVGSLKTNADGRSLIRYFEGLRLKSYQDVGGVWTIGYGSTKNVSRDMTISPLDAETRLVRDIASLEKVLDFCIKVPVNSNQYSALSCLIYNIGTIRFLGSELLKKLNSGDYAGAADEFLKWDHVHGTIIPGLFKRREAERALFLNV